MDQGRQIILAALRIHAIAEFTQGLEQGRLRTLMWFRKPFTVRKLSIRNSKLVGVKVQTFDKYTGWMEVSRLKEIGSKVYAARAKLVR